MTPRGRAGQRLRSGVWPGHGLPTIQRISGSGKESRNLVTLFQNPTNTPVMSNIEKSVYDAVQAGEKIQYSVEPVYVGSELVPRGVTITANGDKGFAIRQTVINRPE